jgi:transposase
MDDNAMPHRSRTVTAYLQSKAVTSVPWRAMSPDLNPIEHINWLQDVSDVLITS